MNVTKEEFVAKLQAMIAARDTVKAEADKSAAAEARRRADQEYRDYVAERQLRIYRKSRNRH